MTTSDTKLSLKLFIDNKARKLIFAEADKDCVDFLFHILSLPVGTVTRLLKEKGMNGCLPNLYESIENLNDNYMSDQWKDILLKPKSPVGFTFVPPLSLHNNMTYLYKCYSNCNYASDDSGAFCSACPNQMTRRLTYVAPRDKNGAVVTTRGFVKEVVTYMVMDELVIKPMSANSCITLLNKFNVKDVGELQEQVVEFGMEEALKLLKASLESKAVLTSVFMSCVKTEK